MSDTRSFVPDLLLEQYALGELGDIDESKVEAALRADESLRSRLAALQSSNEEILAEAKPAEIAAAIRRRMLSGAGGGRLGVGIGRGAPSRSLPAFFLPAAAALLVLAGAFMARSLLSPSIDELTRPKGGEPGISIYRKAASGPMELHDGAAAAEGDVLQIKYGAGEAGFGAIFSVDGRGTITRHFPSRNAEAGTKAPRLSSSGAALDSAYELDDAPGFERFFIFSSKKDFDLSIVLAAMRGLAASGPLSATGAPHLPDTIEWKSLLLVKKGVPR
jgi:hypothetical protein